MHRQKAWYVQQVGACLFKDLKTRTTNKHNIILVFAFTLVDHTANCFWKYWFSNAPSPGDFLSPPCGWSLTPLVLCAGPSPSSNTQSLCIKTHTYAQHGLNPLARSHEGVLSNSFNHMLILFCDPDLSHYIESDPLISPIPCTHFCWYSLMRRLALLYLRSSAWYCVCVSFRCSSTAWHKLWASIQ